MVYYSKALAAIVMASTIQTGLAAAPCDLLTENAFNSIAPAATFPYSYSGFCTAVTNWNANNPSHQIFMGATEADQKAELAAFMGNIRHESDDMKAAREYYMCQTQTTVNGKVYCKPTGYNTGPYDDPYCSLGHTPSSNPAGCACSTITDSTVPGYLDADLLFLGRGAIQLSWNYNYFYAGADLDVDLCTNPDLVSTNEEVNWGAAIWFWTKNTGATGTTCSEYVAAGSFGGTVKTINGGLECPAAASHYGSVVGRMNDYCIAANVLSGGSLLTLDECSGLQSVFDTCKSNGSCPACNGENPPPPSPSPPSGGTYNYCGSSWADANTQCGVPCPNGQGDCTASGGTCYADATNCPVNSPSTSQPTSPPTHAPSHSPTHQPTSGPTSNPTPSPTKAPVTASPTAVPTPAPTGNPTEAPTNLPTSAPTNPAPTQPPTTASPTEAPTNQPTNVPTTATPTQPPTAQPTISPTTAAPTPLPTLPPTNSPIPAGWFVDGDRCVLGVTLNESMHPSASACCSADLSFMDEELCVSLSTGVPTNKFYADQTNSVCRQDCEVGNGLPCGGSPTDVSLSFYTSLELCCGTKISWEPNCVDKSKGTEPQGTGKYYVNWSYGKCAKDCPEDPAIGCGGVASSWDVKYDTQEACGATLSWVPEGERFYGATTTTTTTGTTTSTATTAAPVTTTTATPTGWYLDGEKCSFGQSTETLYASASDCCMNQLSFMDDELCVSLSTGVPTNKFYADQTNSVCRQDCDVGNGLPCGGSPTDVSLSLYTSLELCCGTKVPWEPTCVDKSKGTEPQGTGKYYVNWSFGKCALDCPDDITVGCGGVANSWDVKYDTQEACGAAISWKPEAERFYGQ